MVQNWVIRGGVGVDAIARVRVDAIVRVRVDAIVRVRVDAIVRVRVGIVVGLSLSSQRFVIVILPCSFSHGLQEVLIEPHLLDTSYRDMPKLTIYSHILTSSHLETGHLYELIRAQ
jgi:hypothetical protein